MLCYLVDPIFQVINTAGKPATGGYIEVYVHGTGDKYYCASDFDGTLHPFKIPLDSLGSNIILADDANAYDIYAYNRYGSLLMSRYNVAVSNSGGGGGNVSRKGTIHKLGLWAVDAADTPPKPSEYWIIDLESPNENEPSGYDRLTVEKAREIHNAGAFFGLRTEHVHNPYEDNLLLETYYDYVSMAQTFEVKLANIQDSNRLSEYTLGNFGDYVGVAFVTERNLSVPTASTATPLNDGTASAGSSTQWSRGDHVHPTDTSREAVSNKAQVVVDSSTTDYPSSKAVADFVNSSIATNTANFLGTYDVVEDLGLSTSATNSQIATALGNYTFATTPTNNDYVFAAIDLYINTGADEYRRFKFNGTAWAYEYTLNNSSFTATQWAAINSGLSSSNKTTYDAAVSTLNAHVADSTIHVTSTDKTNWNNKQDAISDLETIRSGAAAGATALQPSGNGSNLTITPDGSTGTTFTSGGKLSALAQKFMNLVSSLKALAFKDKVTDSDISGTISDAHIASASTWNGKQDAISTDTDSSTISDATTIATGYGSNKVHLNTAARLWSYIQDKISSVLGLTSSAYGGKAASLNASAGGPSQPVYFPSSGADLGKPVAIPMSTDPEVAAVGDFLAIQSQGAYYAHKAGNAATADAVAWVNVSGKPTIPDDANLVHKSGAETITGQKTFSENLPILQNDSTSLKLNKKILIGNAGTNYNSWDSSLKDGNHYRRWRIKLGIDSQESYYFVVNVYSTYINGDSVGVVSAQYSLLPNYAIRAFHTNKRGYLPVESINTAKEFRLSYAFYDDTDGYCIDIVSSTPTSNNPITVVIDVGSKVLKNITLSDVTIIEGWPSWAGDINVAPRLQSNEKNVMLAGDSATDATYSTKIGSSSSHPAIGSATQPVYVDRDGAVQPCTLKGVYLSQYNADSLSKIIDAFNSGLLVFSKYAGDVYLLLDADSNGATFVCNTTVDGKTYYSTLTVNSSNTWSRTTENIFNNIIVRKHYGANHEASVITTATDISNGYVEYALDFTDMIFGGGNSILFISLPNESTLAYYFTSIEVTTYPYTTGQNSIGICKFTDLTHDDDGNAIGANDEYTWLRTCNSLNYIQHIKGLKLRCYLNTTSGMTWQAGIELKLKLDFNAVRFDKL